MLDRRRDPREHVILQATASHLVPSEKFRTLPSTVLYGKKLTPCRTTQAAGVREIGVLRWQSGCTQLFASRLAPGGFVKKLQSLPFLATLAVVIGMISWGSVLNAQTTPSTTPDTPAAQQTPRTQPTPSPEMPPSSEQAPNAQQPPSQTPDATAPESGSKADSSNAPTDTQTFSGTVVKHGDKYILKDDSGKIYDIDHQSEVAKFEGKRVRVQGTLDANGKILVK